MLQEEKGSSVSFAPGEIKATAPAQDAAGQLRLGLTVGSIGALEQRYYNLPAGVLITGVDAQGCAATAGLAVGDVIVSFNGDSVLTAEALAQAPQKCQAGDSVQMEIYRHRGEKQFTVTVILCAKG
jgi:serine protease Do